MKAVNCSGTWQKAAIVRPRRRKFHVKPPLNMLHLYQPFSTFYCEKCSYLQKSSINFIYKWASAIFRLVHFVMGRPFLWFLPFWVGIARARIDNVKVVSNSRTGKAQIEIKLINPRKIEKIDTTSYIQGSACAEPTLISKIWVPGSKQIFFCADPWI